MSSDRARMLRFAAVMFLIALVAYGVLYSLDRHARLRRGPWVVTFTTNAAGEPMLLLQQPALGIAQREVIFGDERVPPGFTPSQMRFEFPEPVPRPVGFGVWIYHDLMFLPGVVTLEFFPEPAAGNRTIRHEVELLPRTLFVNRSEQPWQSLAPLRLTRQDKKDWSATSRK